MIQLGDCDALSIPENLRDRYSDLILRGVSIN